jgi:uracil phosphoribosyltransferase
MEPSATTGKVDVTVLDHPLIQHKLSLMRDRRTPTILFRQLLREIAMMMGYEVTRDLPLTLESIETPLTPMDAPTIAGKKIALVAVLRAGLGMVEGLADLIPGARIGHIGLYRDPKTHEPVEYFIKLPDPEDRLFILCDPMLALNERGISDDRIRLVVLVAAPEGVARVNRAHPTVPVFTAALDERLNEKAYILPGLGDAGDRLFGTK